MHQVYASPFHSVTQPFSFLPLFGHNLFVSICVSNTTNYFARDVAPQYLHFRIISNLTDGMLYRF